MKHRVNPWTIVLILAIVLTVYLFLYDGPFLALVASKVMCLGMAYYDVLLLDSLLRDGELGFLSNYFNNIEE